MRVNTQWFFIVCLAGFLWSCEQPVTPEPPTYGVTYLANGSSGGAPPSDPGRYRASATVTASVNSGALVRTGYTFIGWNTAADGSGQPYAEGAAFAMPAGGITLFASWSKAVVGTPTPPGTFTVVISGPASLVFEKESTYTVTYDGTANSYQWNLNGTPISGATTSTLAVTPSVTTWPFGANLLSLVIKDLNNVSYTGNLTVTVGN